MSARSARPSQPSPTARRERVVVAGNARPPAGCCAAVGSDNQQPTPRAAPSQPSRSTTSQPPKHAHAGGAGCPGPVRGNEERMMHARTTPPPRGLPTPITLAHSGSVVPAVEQAVAFFTSVLGGEFVSLDAPLVCSDDRRARWYHVHPRASARFAFVRCGHAPIERTAWHSPNQNRGVPSHRGLGGRHPAIAVRDVAAALASLGPARRDGLGQTCVELGVLHDPVGHDPPNRAGARAGGQPRE